MVHNNQILNMIKSINGKDKVLFSSTVNTIICDSELSGDDRLAKLLREESKNLADGLFVTKNDDGSDASDKKDISHLLMEVDLNIRFDSVILSHENRIKIEKVRTEMKFKDQFRKYGLEPMNRLLFYGATGCGKTYLGKALSNELGFEMLYIDIASSLTQGNVTQNLMEIFKVANSGNYLLFLDEADSIAWSRDENTNQEDGNRRRVTNSLFQQMDQMNPDVLLICATNMLSRLDPAFERRFNEKFCFLKPHGGYSDIFKKFVRGRFKFEVDCVDTVKENKFNCSYYELEGIADRAMKSAIIKGSDTIKMSDIYNETEYWKKERSAEDIELE